MYDSYGQEILSGAANILPGEERIKHTYEFYTRERMQERILETLHIFMSVQNNGVDNYRKYIYKLIENDEESQITFEYLTSEGDAGVPEKPQKCFTDVVEYLEKLEKWKQTAYIINTNQ